MTGKSAFVIIQRVGVACIALFGTFA